MYTGEIGKIMRRRVIYTCAIGIFACGICGCVQTTGDIPALETENVETESTKIGGEDAADIGDAESADTADVEYIETEDEKVVGLEFTGTLEEIPELGYSGGTYICYKDMLVFDFDDTVYRWQNGKYQRTDESLADMLGIKNQRYFTYRQSKNLIISESEDEKSFMIYDMDTDSGYAYPCNHSIRIWDWYICDGEIHYTEYDKEEYW